MLYRTHIKTSNVSSGRKCKRKGTFPIKWLMLMTRNPRT